MANEITRFKDSVTGAEVELSVEEIKRTLCPKASDKEATSFLQLCRHMGLNPWVNDAYLIKYGDDRPATMVVGKDAFTKRADNHPQFAGIESGVIVQSGDKVENRRGTLVLSSETIVGGWARVARNDRKLDMETSVTFSEFKKSTGVWNQMPSIMIEKCAIVKGLRAAFPQTFSGMYDAAEMRDIQMDDQGEIVLGEEAIIIESVESKPQSPSTVEAVEAVEEAELSNFTGRPVETANAVAEDDEVPDGVQPIEEPATQVIEVPPNCVRPGHEPGTYQVHKNDATGERRWAHTYQYELNGKKPYGWCVYSGSIQVPPEPASP